MEHSTVGKVMKVVKRNRKCGAFPNRKYKRRVRSEGFHLICGEIEQVERKGRVCKGEGCTTILRKERPEHEVYCSVCAAKRIREDWHL